jgi:hypothetical protein
MMLLFGPMIFYMNTNVKVAFLSSYKLGLFGKAYNNDLMKKNFARPSIPGSAILR